MKLKRKALQVYPTLYLLGEGPTTVCAGQQRSNLQQVEGRTHGGVCFIYSLFYKKNLRHGHGYKQGAGNAFPRVVGRKLTDLLSTCTRVAACRKYTGVGMGRREVRGKARRRKKSDIVARVRESLKGFGRNTTVACTLAKTRSEQESLTPSSDVMVSIGCMRAVMVLKMIDFVLFRKLPTASIELSFEVDQLSLRPYYP